MTPVQAYNTRAILAHGMSRGGGYTAEDIAKVLRLTSRDDVRKLLGRARQLRRLSDSSFRRATGS